MRRATRALSALRSPQIGTSSSSSMSRSARDGAEIVCRPETTVTPSGSISWACSAADPCQTPSERVALPPTAAASGAVQSTRICPGSITSRRLLRFSDWARKGTVRKTICPLRAASAFSRPSTSAPGTRSRIRAAASSARSAERDPITVACPALAQRSAMPAPSAPVPPIIGIGSGRSREFIVAPVRLEGRKALVTGGASGIGAAIAARLAAEGAEVWVGDINLEGAERVAGEISGHPIELDVTELEAARAAVEAVGTPDILINNAGTDEFGFFTYTTPEQWQRVIGINLFGVLNCTHAALGPMQEAGYGRIVSISSEAGRVGSKGSAVYSAAKAGVIGFMKTIGRENARYGITANSIAPGPIETPLLMGATEFGEIGEKIIETMKELTQMKRLGQPEEVAAAVAFLASDDATYVTGETLGVSGGLGMV